MKPDVSTTEQCQQCLHFFLYNQGTFVMGVGCWRVLIKVFVWMWRVTVSLAAAETKPGSAPGIGCL